MTEWLKYVPHGQIVRHLCSGWKIQDELHGTSHGEYAVLMLWTGGPAPWLD